MSVVAMTRGATLGGNRVMIDGSAPQYAVVHVTAVAFRVYVLSSRFVRQIWVNLSPNPHAFALSGV